MPSGSRWRAHPVPLVQDVASDPESAAGRFDYSRSGMFAFRTGAGVQAWTVGRLGGDGKIAPLLSKPAMYYSPRFSPDGRRLAVAIDAGKGMDIVVHDFERDTTSPVTFNAETNADPVWTSDGAHFVFRSLCRKQLAPSGGFVPTVPAVHGHF